MRLFLHLLNRPISSKKSRKVGFWCSTQHNITLNINRIFWIFFTIDMILTAFWSIFSHFLADLLRKFGFKWQCRQCLRRVTLLIIKSIYSLQFNMLVALCVIVRNELYSHRHHYMLHSFYIYVAVAFIVQKWVTFPISWQSNKSNI